MLADLAMLSHLGTDVLAAVGYCAQFLFLAQSVLMALGAAGVALMSRALGAGEPERARGALVTFLALGGVIGAGSALLGLVAPRLLLALVDAAPSVAELGLPYMRATLGAALFLGFSIALESGYRSARNTRLPLAITALVAAVKLTLNAGLIFGLAGLPELGLLGAGIATLGAHAVGLVGYAWSARRPGRPESVLLRLGRRDLGPVRALLPEAFRVSWPAALERVIMQSALMGYFWALSGYGPQAIAAYAVGMRLLSFSWIPGTGYAIAAATLVGQSLGAQDPAGARAAAARALRWSVVTALLIGGVYLLTRDAMVGWFSDDPEVLAMIAPFIVVMAFAQPIIASNFTMAGALRGSGDTITPLLASFAGTWGVRLPPAVILGRLLHVDVSWVFALLALDHVVRLLIVSRAYARGAWSERLGSRTG